MEEPVNKIILELPIVFELAERTGGIHAQHEGHTHLSAVTVLGVSGPFPSRIPAKSANPACARFFLQQIYYEEIYIIVPNFDANANGIANLNITHDKKNKNALQSLK